MIEPIQADTGLAIPDVEYLKKVKELCQKHNVLFIADELNTGLGRTGKMLATEWDKVKPDIAVIGESLGGGVYPISAVMGPKKVMKVLTPGTHGSTFGGNPLGCAIARASIETIISEKILLSVKHNAKIMEAALGEIKSPLVKEIRMKGLLAGIEIEESLGVSGYHLAEKLS